MVGRTPRGYLPRVIDYSSLRWPVGHQSGCGFSIAFSQPGVSMHRRVLFSAAAVSLAALALTACTGATTGEGERSDGALEAASAVDTGLTTLERRVVNPALAEQLAEITDVIYLATPLWPSREREQQAQDIVVLDAGLEIQQVIPSPGRGVFSFDIDSDGVLHAIRENCTVLNGAGAECSAIGPVTAEGLLTDDSADELGLDGHELVFDEQRGGYWAIRYGEIACEADSAYPSCDRVDSDGQPLEFFYDCEILRIDEGEVAYRWSAAETFPAEQWRGEIERGDPTSDPFHCNSVEPRLDSDEFIVSARNTDAVFAVDMASGQVSWKLGGVYWPGVSLTIENEINAGYGVTSTQQGQLFGGQHDARLWNDGTLSVFDNRSGTGQPARGMVFEFVDESTVRVVQVMDDPGRNLSMCTGSLRKFEGTGFWVAGWGCSYSGLTVFDEFSRPVVELFRNVTAARESGVLATDVPPEIAGALGYRAVIGARVDLD